MRLTLLDDRLQFPPVERALPEGILAVGGDLSVERLLLAYRRGIFPWYGEGEPILWWAPDPRFVLYPDNLRVTNSMRRVLRSGRFEITFDHRFNAVIEACRRVPRKDQPGTWIMQEMVDAYAALHRAGYAHSVEAWRDGELVGGLYGVALGSAFFGESMFALERDASKAAFITLVGELKRRGCNLIDCQVPTDHLASLGAGAIPRVQFMAELAVCLDAATVSGAWDELNDGLSLSHAPVK